MRPEKQLITQEYLRRLNSSPFVIVVDYQGLRVGPLTDLRRRLAKAGAELLVVKNTLFRLAAREAGLGDLGPMLTGMLAVVTGQRDICAAAKVLKSFAAEFDRPKLRFGFLGRQRLEPADLLAIAELPPLETLQATLLGLLGAPATRLLGLLQAPAAQLLRLLQARSEQLSQASKQPGPQPALATASS
jgi:large subunit ribosomal protein L10